MLLIPCPNCGPRDEAEFTHGGILRPLPALDGQTTAGNWHVALHQPAAETPQQELWYHRAGCETWFAAARDRKRHDFGPAETP